MPCAEFDSEVGLDAFIQVIVAGPAPPPGGKRPCAPTDASPEEAGQLGGGGGGGSPGLDPSVPGRCARRRTCWGRRGSSCIATFHSRGGRFARRSWRGENTPARTARFDHGTSSPPPTTRVSDAAGTPPGSRRGRILPQGCGGSRLAPSHGTAGAGSLEPALRPRFRRINQLSRAVPRAPRPSRAPARRNGADPPAQGRGGPPGPPGAAARAPPRTRPPGPGDPADPHGAPPALLPAGASSRSTPRTSRRST